MLPTLSTESKERMRAVIFNTAIAPRPGEDWRDALRRQVAVTRPTGPFSFAQRLQRRRARQALAASFAEVEALKQANAMALGLLLEVREQRDAYRDTLTEARHVLGNHHALPPLVTGNHPHPKGGNFDFAPREAHTFESLQNMDRWATAKTNIGRMHELLAQVKVDRIVDEVHCYVRMANGDMAYCMSGAALRSMRGRPRDLARMIEREIAPRLSRRLAEVLCKGGA